MSAKPALKIVREAFEERSKGKPATKEDLEEFVGNILAELAHLPQSRYDLEALKLTDETMRYIELGRIFDSLLQVLCGLNVAFEVNKQMHPGRDIRAYSISALEVLRDALDKVRKTGDKRNLPFPLPVGLEALVIELEEVSAGKKSTLFLPNAPEQSKVKLAVRAAAAAALHVLIEQQILPAEQAAWQISDHLFNIKKISRADAEAHEHYPVPPDTIQDWRNRRDRQPEHFREVFSRSVQYITLQLEGGTDDRVLTVLNSLNYLLTLITFT
jgi:hypothetical protein